MLLDENIAGKNVPGWNYCLRTVLGLYTRPVWSRVTEVVLKDSLHLILNILSLVKIKRILIFIDSYGLGILHPSGDSTVNADDEEIQLDVDI